MICNCFLISKDQHVFLSRMERMLVVARRMLRLTAVPGFKLTSPASSIINANLHIGLKRGTGSNV